MGVVIRLVARANARDLACALDLARNLDRALDLARDLDRDRAHALADTLVRARDIARVLVDLDSASPGVRAVVAGGARSMPGRVSRGLVALAVRMLPAAQRPRYRAEFRVELVELPRRERWGYALRVLTSAWELRWALAEVMCTPNGAPARRAER